MKEYFVEYAPVSRFHGERPGPFATWAEAKLQTLLIEDLVVPTKLDIVTLVDGNEVRRDSLL